MTDSGYRGIKIKSNLKLRNTTPRIIKLHRLSLRINIHKDNTSFYHSSSVVTHTAKSK